MASNFFHAHLHSQFSTLDGMSDVRRMVRKAARLDQPAASLTDHGNMAGSVRLYQECKAHGMKAFPGVEGYLLDPTYEGSLTDKGADKIQRYHMGILALDERGYMALVKFVSMTHTRPRFSRFPRFTLSDLAKLGQEHGRHLAITTGCFFGLVQQTLISKGDDEALRMVKMLANWFPHTFVEVQHHNIIHEPIQDEAQNFQTDDALVTAMLGLADQSGLPVIATQDCHYTDQSEKKAHALMKRMTYGAGDVNEFPGDAFHLASWEWVAEHYWPDHWSRFEDGYERLYDLNDMKIEPLDTYTVDIPRLIDEDPDRYIRDKCRKRLDRVMVENDFSKTKRKKYEDRMLHELGVIRQLGMASYFVIWDQFVSWCKEQAVCIEARGSANGSLVCFLLGVTQVDPVKWDCLFERFLSLDRTKPPDIDLDIEDHRRDEAIAHMQSLLDCVQIGTWSKMGTSIDHDTGEERGSVFVSWIQSKRRKCEEDAWEREKRYAEQEGRKPVKYKATEKGKQKFAREFGWMQGLRDVQRYSGKDYVGLKRLAHMDSVYRSYGVHAAGVLLSGDDTLIEDYIPTMLVASSNTTVTQFDGDDAEEFGLLKMDLLGQTSLTVMRMCQELIGREDPTDFQWIPENDREALKLLRTGRTDTGLFHFEGYTKAKGGREVKVRSINDAILVQALYMPGCMDIAPGQKISQKDLYLQRRNSTAERERVKYIHPAFESALKYTHGAVVYQEQVINIMRGLGMSIPAINKFFKVVKDSGRGAVERNRERLAEVRGEFDDHCAEAGIDSDVAWNQTAAFVAYGFNRAHASGYGIRSYRTAYLKAHYPLEYMTALLQAWAGKTKEKIYMREVRRMRIRMMPPDVNYSKATWAIDKKNNAIRKGLVTIHGIGGAAAEEIAKRQPFKSVEDLCFRCKGRGVTGKNDYLERNEYKGTLKTLKEAGALDSLDG
jgi:DNA polymerase III subunit alpha